MKNPAFLSECNEMETEAGGVEEKREINMMLIKNLMNSSEKITQGFLFVCQTNQMKKKEGKC